MEVISEKQNLLCNRKEIVVQFTDIAATPSRKQVTEDVSKKFGCNAELVVIDRIEQNFGSKKANARVRVYDNAEEKAKYEKGWKDKRTKGKEKKG